MSSFEYHSSRRPGARRALLALVILVVGACSSSTSIGVPVDSRSQLIAAAVGEEIDVTLGNVGPSTYVSPPTVSSSVLTFLDMRIVPPNNPGGTTQRFRFRAVAKGEAIVDFQRTLADSVVSTVEDTVMVH